MALILLISLGVRMYQLATPSAYMFDEVYYAKDADVIAHNKVGPTPLPLGPPARKSRGRTRRRASRRSPPASWCSATALSAGACRRSLAGMLILACIYPLARSLGLSPAWSLIALAFAAADTPRIAQSRIATLDIFIAVWTVVCILMALRYIQEGRRLRWLLLCGATGGFATVDQVVRRLRRCSPRDCSSPTPGGGTAARHEDRGRSADAGTARRPPARARPARRSPRTEARRSRGQGATAPARHYGARRARASSLPSSCCRR